MPDELRMTRCRKLATGRLANQICNLNSSAMPDDAQVSNRVSDMQGSIAAQYGQNCVGAFRSAVKCPVQVWQ